MKKEKQRSPIVSKIAASFQVVKAVWSGSFAGLSVLSVGSLARWGSISWNNIARKAVQNPYSYRSIVLIAETLSSVPLVVKKTRSDDDPEFDKEHEVIKLLNRPDDKSTMSRLQFFCKIVWNLHIGGEIFVRKISPSTGPNRNKPKRLKLLRPDRITRFLYDENDDVRSYVWTGRKGSRQEVPAEEVFHLMMYNPLTATSEDARGLPILVAALRAIELMRESEDWNKSIAQQKGKPPGVFKRTERGKTGTDKLDALKEQVQDVWKADAKNSLPAVLPFGWDFQEIGKSLKDAEFSEGDKANMRKIAVSLGVDPALLGDNQNRTVNNMKEAVTGLLTLRVLPLLDFILDGFTVDFMLDGLLKPGECLTYQRDSIEALKEEMTQKFERLFGAVDRGVYTRDEARAELNKNPNGGNSAIQTVAINTVPLDSIGVPGGTGNEEEERELRDLLEISVKSFDTLLGRNGIHKTVNNN